jgi:two-component system chemotaxis response regulator CheB
MKTTGSSKKIRVLIVEDSLVIRQFLEHIIARDPRLEIAGAVESGEEALRVLNRITPDVISMDVRLPGMSGFEATERIMQERPTPVVVVSGSVDRTDSHMTIEALRAGALAVLEKPPGMASSDYEALAERLCTQLAIMSQVKVVRRHGTARQAPVVYKRANVPLHGPVMLGLVSSTGGPRAIAQVLAGLGPGFPLPILLVQHITSNFLEPFAQWLETISGFPVEVVRDRSIAEAGHIYLAAPDHHLRAGPGTVRVDRGDPVCAQRPSGTALFESMGEALGSRGIGVLLTGMGEDGAEGLLQLRQQGGYTIAEDASTAIVYGMPGAAERLGAVAESLPLPAIAPRILQLIHARCEVA